MRWYDRPHEGAHATEVTEYATGPSLSNPGAGLLDAGSPPGAREAGLESRESTVDGRREGES